MNGFYEFFETKFVESVFFIQFRTKIILLF